MYQLEVELKKGNNLKLYDKGGTSDPYVKFKIDGEQVFTSKVIGRTFNPVWNEETTLKLNSLTYPLSVQVHDSDCIKHNIMGCAELDLESLELQKTTPVTLYLKDPKFPIRNQGTLELNVTLKAFWRKNVSVALLVGRSLQPMDANGLSDPYVIIKLGDQRYKSKTVEKTLNPEWREQFDFLMTHETGEMLDIKVLDSDIVGKDDEMGTYKLDLSRLAKKKTHRLELNLKNGSGYIVLKVSVVELNPVSIDVLSPTSLADPQENSEIQERYGVSKSLQNMKDVGTVQVKVISAKNLMAADINGKSDPYCVLELNSDKLQTHTIYKTLNPEWNTMFTLNIKDITSVLNVTLYDEDKHSKHDFLGKIAIPLLSVQNGKKTEYLLKNKNLTRPFQGSVVLEINVIYNKFKAVLQTIKPCEQKETRKQKFSPNLLQQNVKRVERFCAPIPGFATYFTSCIIMESFWRSFVFLVLLFAALFYLDIFIISLWVYYFTCKPREHTSAEEMFELAGEEEEKEAKNPFELFSMIQNTILDIQNVLEDTASNLERIKNTFNNTVPFLSHLGVVALALGSFGLCICPGSWLNGLIFVGVCLAGLKCWYKRQNPDRLSTNELLNFLSRVPTDVQVMQTTNTVVSEQT